MEASPAEDGYVTACYKGKEHRFRLDKVFLPCATQEEVRVPRGPAATGVSTQPPASPDSWGDRTEGTGCGAGNTSLYKLWECCNWDEVPSCPALYWRAPFWGGCLGEFQEPPLSPLRKKGTTLSFPQRVCVCV